MGGPGVRGRELGGPPGIPRPVQCLGPRRVLRGQVLTSDPTPSPRPRLVQGQGGLSLGVQGPQAGGGAVSPQMRIGGVAVHITAPPSGMEESQSVPGSGQQGSPPGRIPSVLLKTPVALQVGYRAEGVAPTVDLIRLCTPNHLSFGAGESSSRGLVLGPTPAPSIGGRHRAPCLGPNSKPLFYYLFSTSGDTSNGAQKQ